MLTLKLTIILVTRADQERTIILTEYSQYFKLARWISFNEVNEVVCLVFILSSNFFVLSRLDKCGPYVCCYTAKAYLTNLNSAILWAGNDIGNSQ